LSETTVTAETQNRFSSQPAGYLLGRFGLLLVLAGLVIAAWNGQTAIAILLGLVLSAAALSRLWSRLSLKGVSCQRLVSENRFFPGEYMELKLRVVNRKLLPLPWLQIDDELPVRLAPELSPVPGNRTETGLLSKSAALLWYTSITWRHRLLCYKRGYYTLGPLKVTSGDIFGFYPRSTTEPSIENVIVYPRILPISQLGIPSLFPLGETRAERRIFEDPTRTIGVRNYNPGDSLRHIHWKASARHQNLQVKVFEPTTTLKVALFLAVDSFPQNGAQSEDDFETGISVAASIANYLTEQGSPAGLFVNTLSADSGQPVIMPPGSGNGQLVGILEALAKVTPQASSPFEEFWQRPRRDLPWGTTLIFILYRPSDQLTSLLISLRERGHKLLVIQVGEQKGSRMEHGVTWHNVMHIGDTVKISSKGDG